MSRLMREVELDSDNNLEEISDTLRRIASRIDRVIGTRRNLNGYEIGEVLEYAIKIIRTIDMERFREICEIDRSRRSEREAVLEAMNVMSVVE